MVGAKEMLEFVKAQGLFAITVQDEILGCLRGDCPDLAMADRWRCANPMGSCRQCGLTGRYGDHHAPTGSTRL